MIAVFKSEFVINFSFHFVIGKGSILPLWWKQLLGSASSWCVGASVSQ